MRKATVTLLLLLASCHGRNHVDLVGSFNESGQGVTGKATGVPGIAGDVVLQGDHGLSCTGTWKYITAGMGAGTLQCADGETGTFLYLEKDGTSYGQIGNRLLTIKFTPIMRQ
jgi:hypothetical protein